MYGSKCGKSSSTLDSPEQDSTPKESALRQYVSLRNYPNHFEVCLSYMILSDTIAAGRIWEHNTGSHEEAPTAAPSKAVGVSQHQKAEYRPQIVTLVFEGPQNY